MSETFGKRLINARHTACLTQSQLTEIVGLGRNSLGRYERDLNEPSLFTATCIAQALNTSLDYLVGLIDEPIADVIRCRDCKYSLHQYDDVYVCSKCMCGKIKGSEYCSKAELKK